MNISVSDNKRLLHHMLNYLGKLHFLEMRDISEKTLNRWKTNPEAIPKYALLRMPHLVKKVAEYEGGFRFIDLFAGIGGIRLGFEKYGGKCVFTSEWNKFSQLTYLENFRDGHAIAGDITRINAEREKFAIP